jgi:hypothetical protein
MLVLEIDTIFLHQMINFLIFFLRKLRKTVKYPWRNESKQPVRITSPPLLKIKPNSVQNRFSYGLITIKIKFKIIIYLPLSCVHSYVSKFIPMSSTKFFQVHFLNNVLVFLKYIMKIIIISNCINVSKYYLDEQIYYLVLRRLFDQTQKLNLYMKLLYF